MDPILTDYAAMITELHATWTPHEGQIIAGRAFFHDNIHSIFIQCGRKWGKTEIALYFLWRIAQTYPNSPCYFIGPLAKQVREIVWEDPRLKNFGPRSWLLDGSRGVSESDMRLRFKNGSFIKIDGSDNYESYRGPKFKICVYEEFKDMHPMFRRAMRPNASVLSGLELFIGSPPDRECDYTVLAEEHKTNPRMFFFQAPTWQNPNISREWLQNEKQDHYNRGEGDVWEREYEAKFVKGGKAKIFPMISEKMIKPHDDLMKLLFRDRKKLSFYIWADPAGATCFAVLFCAINPYTKDVYWLDEIYETDQARMTVKVVGRELLRKRDELMAVGTIRQGYDEAATWFANEMLDAFSEHFEPTQKASNKKESGLSLIKDIMLAGKWHMSDRCKKFYWELDNHFKDKNGNIPKKNDHLIDDARYILAADCYELNAKAEEQEFENRRGISIEQDFPHLAKENQWDSWS